MKKTFVAMTAVFFMVLQFVSCNKQNIKTNDADTKKNQEETQPLAEIQEPEPEDRKTFFVSESLRLRKSESTDSEIIATMIIGTEVEILETGKAETIGGVSGNWVKIQVVNDVTDLKGNAMQGTVGWCFSGYLIEDATRFGLIGDWENERNILNFKSDGEFSFGWKESEGIGGKWNLDGQTILLSVLDNPDNEPHSEEWKLVNLDAQNLQFVRNGETFVLTRVR